MPVSYQIAFVPDLAALTIDGSESIKLRFRSASSRIEFNTLNETLSDVRLDDQPVRSVSTSAAHQLTTVTLAHPAAPGMHVLTLHYRGKIETQPQGIYLQHYLYPGGTPGTILSTKMEATDARRMFPCWDEPAFRATFELTATVPAGWSTVANMPIAHRAVSGDRATVTFEPTPKMPSYLVEFSAGELAAVEDRSSPTTVGVWAARGQQQQGAAALANARQILTDYNDYFGFAYPLPKLDSIAVPGGFSGAMENWGAITYNDQLLLLGPASDVAQHQRVFSVQAHEMAHQWNGDLVTMGWWDDLWLNESFASWMSAKETAQRNPSWHWLEGEDASKESAMRADALVGSHPIQQHIIDELQIEGAFDPQITYDKGEAFLRMLESYVGPGVFRDAVRHYLRTHAFSNATTADLWQALDHASGRDIAHIAAAWTEQPGYPLVAASSSCTDGRRRVTLSQTRFLLQGTDESHSSWRVPLQIRTGLSGPPKSVLLTQDGQQIDSGRCDQPLSLNAGAVGFYRVQYDAALLQTNAGQFGQLPNGDRIALLDDQWALAQARAQPLSEYFALARSMGADLNARAWEQIASALSTLEYYERGSPGHDAFAAFASSIVNPALQRLGWNKAAAEDIDRQELRRTLITDLGEWGDASVLAQAHERYQHFLQDQSSLSPEEQSFVLAAVARDADSATFEQLHALARGARSVPEMQRFYNALVGVRNVGLAEQAAQIIISPEIPPQGTNLRFGLVAHLARAHPALAWNLFTTHTDMFMAAFGHNRPLYLAQLVPQIFWNGVPLEQLEAWVKPQIAPAMLPVLTHGMANARLLLDQKAALVPEADASVSRNNAQARR